MVKQKLLLLFLFAAFSIKAYTQSTPLLLIYKNDNTVESIRLADIDSIVHADVFLPCAGQTSITYNGYTYQLVEIGSQCWFAENLQTVQYRNGDSIPNVTDSIQWSNLTTGAWVHYNNESLYENPYGKLYNWFAVSDSRNLCPAGWHIPTDADWTILTDYLGGFSVAGGKMKSEGTQFWLSPNTQATNSSGFSGLPGGYRFYNGAFNYIENHGYWWSSSEFASTFSWYRALYNTSGITDRHFYNIPMGMSCRCIRDSF